MKEKKTGIVTVRLTELQMQYLQGLVDSGVTPKGLPAAIKHILNQMIILGK
ncbi:hypothetical protein [Leclercia adecarboxylata]|uniref:hypothetical protein n=1 Tax=Leclercia adecarboxylata TaxID=83655 RepID=UPI0013FD711F|nr:hypothetical protein [Leclercia adecarboxylata]QIM42026.1 hypothetical protein G7098_04425 [Leclercia adecarboxylata]